MAIRMLGIHYPRADSLDDFIQRTCRVAAFLRSQADCLDVDVWRTVAGDAVVSSAVFQTPEALQAALAATRDLPEIAFDDRETQHRQIFQLVQPDQTSGEPL
ncbi:MAG: hypothetical protein ACRDQA_11855 [Nocardioidaceae bacterium]